MSNLKPIEHQPSTITNEEDDIIELYEYYKDSSNFYKRNVTEGLSSSKQSNQYYVNSKAANTINIWNTEGGRSTKMNYYGIKNYVTKIVNIKNGHYNDIMITPEGRSSPVSIYEYLRTDGYGNRNPLLDKLNDSAYAELTLNYYNHDLGDMFVESVKLNKPYWREPYANRGEWGTNNSFVYTFPGYSVTDYDPIEQNMRFVFLASFVPFMDFMKPTNSDIEETQNELYLAGRQQSRKGILYRRLVNAVIEDEYASQFGDFINDMYVIHNGIVNDYGEIKVPYRVIKHLGEITEIPYDEIRVANFYSQEPNARTIEIAQGEISLKDYMTGVYRGHMEDDVRTELVWWCMLSCLYMDTDVVVTIKYKNQIFSKTINFDIETIYERVSKERKKLQNMGLQQERIRNGEGRLVINSNNKIPSNFFEFRGDTTADMDVYMHSDLRKHLKDNHGVKDRVYVNHSFSNIRETNVLCTLPLYCNNKDNPTETEYQEVGFHAMILQIINEHFKDKMILDYEKMMTTNENPHGYDNLIHVLVYMEVPFIKNKHFVFELRDELENWVDMVKSPKHGLMIPTMETYS